MFCSFDVYQVFWYLDSAHEANGACGLDEIEHCNRVDCGRSWNLRGTQGLLLEVRIEWR